MCENHRTLLVVVYTYIICSYFINTWSR